MNSISQGIRFTVRALNNEPIKEGIKRLIGLAAVGFAFAVICDICRRSFLRHQPDAPPISLTDRVVTYSAKASLILCGATSPLGVMAISKIVHFIFSPLQLERAFGPNTIFAVNPWHPRHVFSIGAVCLAAPILIQSLFRTISQCSCFRSDPSFIQHSRALSPSWIISSDELLLMVCITTVTSRPILHLGNQFARLLLRAM